MQIRVTPPTTPALRATPPRGGGKFLELCFGRSANRRRLAACWIVRLDNALSQPLPALFTPLTVHCARGTLARVHTDHSPPMPAAKLYQPDSPTPFALSRSKVELYMDCPRCF